MLSWISKDGVMCGVGEGGGGGGTGTLPYGTNGGVWTAPNPLYNGVYVRNKWYKQQTVNCFKWINMYIELLKMN